MASFKEAIAFVLDCGQNTDDAPSGTPSFFSKSLQCIRLILRRKIFSESKDEVALILFGTETTDNPLDDGSHYQRVVVKRELLAANLSFMKLLDEVRGTSVTGDFVDALIVAADHLKSSMGDRKFNQQQIYLFSNFGGEASTDKLDTVVRAMKNAGFHLTVIGYDFVDDESLDLVGDYAPRFKCNKTSVQKTNHRTLKKLVDHLDGAYFTFEEADSMLNFFKKRNVRSMPWKVNLELGTSLKIPVCLYLKVKRFGPKPWKKCYGQDPTNKLQHERSYHKKDEAQTECDKDQTVEAYRYGKSLVPFSAEDKANMSYVSGGKSFAVLAFAKQECIKRHHFQGDSVHYVVPDPAYERATVALSAFVHAMYETGMVAIMRYVYSERSNPKIGFIAPIIKPDLECFSFIQLPFMEDLRMYTFAPLNNNPKNIPSDEQLAAVDDLITTMDLTKKDNKGTKKELLKPKTIFNPYVQRLYQCMLHRGLNPEEPIPEPDEQIMKIFAPDENILNASKMASEKIKALFPLKVIENKPDKKTGAALFEDGPKDTAAMDADASTLNTGMAFRGATKEVGTTNPTDNFLELIKSDPQGLEKYCDQMQEVIVKLVMVSFGKLICQENYQKAIECAEVLRKESISTLPNQYNKFVADLKTELLSKGKTDFWENLKTAGNLGPITKAESASSDLTDDEAAEYFTVKEEDRPHVEPVQDDVDDLLDDM